MERKAAFLLLTIMLLAPLPPRSPAAGASYLVSLRDTTSILPRKELRALWVTGENLLSPRSIDRLFELASLARFHILFLQVRGRGDAYYPSALVPLAPALAESSKGFDPLAYALEKAEETGISVHAWLNALCVWSDPYSRPPPGHVLERHPDWVVCDSTGKSMIESPVESWHARGVTGYFLSPALPQVRSHLAKVAAELASHYPLAGIHLDYIRYPGRGFGLGPADRSQFALRYGADPLGLGKPALREQLGAEAAAVLDSLFTEYRAAQVESTVAAVRRAAPGLVLSAAVYPEPGRARVEMGQDWVAWVWKGEVDFVVPMAYNYDLMGVARVMDLAANYVGVDRFLIGLPLFGPRARYLGYAVALARRRGLVGYSLFSYNELVRSSSKLQVLERLITGGESP